MDQARISERAGGVEQRRVPVQVQDVSPRQQATTDQTAPLRGMTVAGAMASVGSRNNMVTSIVMGGDNQIAQIRVLDAVTHEVIAESPPDTITRMQDEMLAYQQVARSSRQS